jgi:hypothetical protein
MISGGARKSASPRTGSCHQEEDGEGGLDRDGCRWRGRPRLRRASRAGHRSGQVIEELMEPKLSFLHGAMTFSTTTLILASVVMLNAKIVSVLAPLTKQEQDVTRELKRESSSLFETFF